MDHINAYMGWKVRSIGPSHHPSPKPGRPYLSVCLSIIFSKKIYLSLIFSCINITIKGVFSSPFHPKKFGFWSIILQNGTKHHANFLAKMYPFSILDFGLKRQKKSQKDLTHLMKILAFWMELNTLMKILAFCISSLQSSWHFAFYGELNTA
jgi:hypothetical protein